MYTISFNISLIVVLFDFNVDFLLLAFSVISSMAICLEVGEGGGGVCTGLEYIKFIPNVI